MKKEDAPRGRYIEAAQTAAIDQALSNAGFDIQFMPVNQTDQPITQTPQKASTERTSEPAPKVASVPTPTVKPQPAVNIPTVSESPVVDVKPVRPEVTKAEIPAEPKIQQTASTVSILSGTQEKVDKVSQETETQHTAVPAIQMEDFEEIIVDEEDTAQSTPCTPSYTSDTPVEQICSQMSLEEAENYVVKDGVCSGWTLAKVKERRPASLKFYANGYSGKDNILRAAAKLILSGTELQAG